MTLIVFTGTFALVVAVLGWIAGGPIGLLVALLFAFLILGALSTSDAFLLRMMGAQPYENQLVEKILTKLSREAKVPQPALARVQTKTPNAFAVNNTIVITEGLLLLKNREIEGVLAHEVAHIKHNDVRVATMAAAMGLGILSAAKKGEHIKNERLRKAVAMIAAGIASFTSFYALLPSREYNADWTGALLTKRPDALASALRKLQPMTSNPATGALWTVGSGGFHGVFETQPPLVKRIERLEVTRAI